MMDDKVCHPAAFFHTNVVDFFNIKIAVKSLNLMSVAANWQCY